MQHCKETGAEFPVPGQTDPCLVHLVDALVEAIDTDRLEAVDRVQAALEPFGAAGLLSSELRLNGRSSEQIWSFMTEFDVEVEF